MAATNWRRRLLLAVIGIWLGLTTIAAHAQGGTSLVVGLPGEPDGLNPLFAVTGATAKSVYLAIFDTLVMTNPHTGVQEPGIATDWEVSEDLLQWTFTLRPGLTFHNGEALDADAVKHTVETLLASGAGTYAFERISPVATVEAPDAQTVVFTTSGPVAEFPAALADIQIYPPAYLDQTGTIGFGDHPIGSGPYEFVEWIRGERLVIRAAGEHWRYTPQVETITFRFLVENSTRIAALERGEIDIAFNVPPDDAERLDALADVRIEWGGQSLAMMIGLKTLLDDAPFADVRVRQAMNYAINKDELIEHLLAGYATKLDGQMVGPDAFGYNPNLEAYPYDPERARELLAEAGYPDGFTWRWQGSFGRYLAHAETIWALAGQLAEVGIDLEVDMMEWATYIGLGPAREVWYVGWAYWDDRTAGRVAQQFLCPARNQQYCNPEFDELYHQARAEFDPQRREVLYQELMALARDEAPVVFLWQSPGIYGVRERVQGFLTTPDDTVHFDTVSVTN